MINVIKKIADKIDKIKDTKILLNDIFAICRDYLDLTQISIKAAIGDDIVVKFILGAAYELERDPISVGRIKNGCENVKVDGEFITCVLLPDVNNTLDFRKQRAFSEEELDFIRLMKTTINLLLRNEQLFLDYKNNENLRLVGMLRATVAHDISNILSIVEVYLNLLKDEVSEKVNALEYIESIAAEVKRVDSISKDMIDISKQKLILNKNVFSVSKIFDSLKRNISVLIKDSDIELKCNIESDFEINADENRLFRVLNNLTSNAVDALHGKGSIYLRFKKVGTYSTFIILDTGKGISQDSLKSLFTPFFTQGKTKGTGLGLVVVKEIVTAHGGKIFVRSHLNKYTCFIIRIPD